MDGLTWDASQFVTNMPILWSTQQEDIEEEAGYSMPNFDSSVVLNQMQETENKPAQTDDHHLYSVCDFVSHYFNTNMAHTQQQQLINGGVSHNDVNQDDRNISMILSDHCRRNIWSFSYNGSAVSSGESQSNNASAAVASSGTRKNKEMQCHASEIDDTASQSTSSHPFVVNQCKIVESSGKNRDICHLNLLDETGSQSSSSHPCVVNEGKILESKPNCAKRSLRLISGNNNPPKPKKPRWDHKRQCSSNINFRQPNSCISSNSNINEEPDPEAIAHMKEMIYRAAAFRPVNLGLEVVEKPRRKNVRISTDPQTVAARQRRERISERIRVLQEIVPGGSKMDTASMLDEAANYLKFLRSQVKALESLGDKIDSMNCTPFSFINPNHNVQQYYSAS